MTQRSEGTGRVYLLTGVTGFLGKVLLEELLRQREELDVGRVQVLIRPRGQRSAEARFRSEVAASDCFRYLPRGWEQWVDVVQGSLEQPGLGLDRTGREDVARRVTHVLHAAASVNFDLPLADAARWNIETSLNLLELARSCSQLGKLVCVSTAYVIPHRGDHAPIDGTLAPLPRPAEEIYGSIRDGSAVEADLLAQTGQPNTYTMTKCLAEHLLVARRGTVPLAIVRPSIISASWRHPFPGWIDSSTGFAAFVALLGMGHLRAVVADPNTRLDLIPVDEAAARVLLACDGGTTADAEPAIRLAVAGFDRSATVRECWERIRDFFSIHRVERRPAMGYLGPPGLRFALADRLYHRLAVTVAGFRSARARRVGGQLLARVAHLNTAFPYFTRNSFAFRSSTPLDDSFDPLTYVTTVSRGVYRHILGGDDTQWVLAGRRHGGHGGDLRWVIRQPRGTAAIRLASWLVTKVLRRCFERVTVDIPSLEAARRAAPEGRPLVIVASHRSYLDFVLCSYLFFARPDLGISIPHVAAAIEFGRIPIVGRLLRSLQAFYLKRGHGREDPDLTRRVHTLLRDGKTVEFFIEGQRSRSREFLPPKRGLLRCIQSSGTTCTLLPITLSYDRVPEEASFALELAGAPKPKMRLKNLLAWALRVFRGEVDLGHAHIACGAPIRLDHETDIRAVSWDVIERLREAAVSTTFHLRTFLDQHPIDGIDVTWLRNAIAERGGRVLESDLHTAEPLDPLTASALRHQFAHLFEAGVVADEPLRRLLHRLSGTRAAAPAREKEPVA